MTLEELVGQAKTNGQQVTTSPAPASSGSGSSPMTLHELLSQASASGKPVLNEQPNETLTPGQPSNNVGSIGGKPIVGGLAGAMIKDPLGTLKAVGGALVSSEVSAGKDISAAIDENLPGVKSAQSKAQAASSQAAGLFSTLLAKRHTMATAGQDTTNIDSVISDEAKTLGITNFDNIIPDAANKSDSEIIGDFGGVALDAATAGTFSPEAKTGELLTKADQVAAKTAKAAQGVSDLTTVAKKGIAETAKGAAVGYGYDVSQNLQQGETGAQALTPGVGTAVGAALPAAFALYNAGKITAKALAPRIDNSLIKPLPKQFRYGANPGRTMAEMGVTGNSWDDLATNIGTAKTTVGKRLSTIGAQLQEKAGGATMDLSQSLSPIVKAIASAASNNDEALMKRLQNVKTAITENLAPKIGDDGTIVGIESKGKRNLAAATFQDALDTKRMIGRITKFTGSPSDDKAVNLALKQVYGSINATSKEFAGNIDEGLAADFGKANGQYADLQTAEVATKHRQELAQGNNLISLGQGIRTSATVVSAILSGGTAIPVILAGASELAVEKALSTPAVKTRVASWLASASESQITKLYADNPAIRSALIKLTKGNPSSS